MHYGAVKHGYLILYKIYAYDLQEINTHIFNFKINISLRRRQRRHGLRCWEGDSTAVCDGFYLDITLVANDISCLLHGLVNTNDPSWDIGGWQLA